MRQAPAVRHAWNVCEQGSARPHVIGGGGLKGKEHGGEGRVHPGRRPMQIWRLPDERPLPAAAQSQGRRGQRCCGHTRTSSMSKNVNAGEVTADSAPAEPAASGGTSAEAAKPITIMVPEGTLRKLKVVAILKDTTVSDLLAEAAAAVVKRDLRKVLGKLYE